MAADQTFEVIPVENLVERVRAKRKEGCRLVQIGATKLPEGIELTYSFDLNSQLSNLRVQVPPESHVPSVSSVFWCAFLYENEIHDLFNAHIDGMAVDFHGTFYQTAVKFPFGRTKLPEASSAPAAGASTPGK